MKYEDIGIQTIAEEERMLFRQSWEKARQMVFSYYWQYIFSSTA